MRIREQSNFPFVTRPVQNLKFCLGTISRFLEKIIYTNITSCFQVPMVGAECSKKEENGAVYLCSCIKILKVDLSFIFIVL